MKIVIYVVLTAFAWTTAASAFIIEKHYETNKNIADQKQDMIANNSRISDLLEHLANTVSENQEKTDAELNELSKDIAATNAEILERIDDLETVYKTSLNSAEDKIISNISALIMPDVAGKLPSNIEAISSCSGPQISGVYKFLDLKKEVNCEMSDFGGNWLVIQQRLDDALSFDHKWVEYRNGFGVPGKDTNFWLGLDAVHRLTNDFDYEIVIELRGASISYGYARYGNFSVAGENEFYQLSVDGFSGSLPDKFSKHNGLYFYTQDSDNSEGCVKKLPGGWWLNSSGSVCYEVNLNRHYTDMYWRNWKNGRATYTRMMIRQTQV